MSESPSSALLNNRYRLLATVAAGGMATVYKAQDTMLNRLVAVKVLRDRYARDPQFVQRFREEAAAAANLNHPNIVTIFDVGSDVLSGQQRHYIVMELIEGEDLKQHQRTRPDRIDVDDAVRLMRQVCEGVAYAHRRGLVHCDLKPQNVMIATDGRAKVTDFGIARAFTTVLNPNEREDVVWGTPQYYAPEQAAGGIPSPASDVYSLGVIVFELLAGRLPFMAADTATLARLHQTAAPPSLSAINPSVSLQLENIVARALVKDPAQRYRSADQMAAALTAYLQQGEENTLMGMAPVKPAAPQPQTPAAKPEAARPAPRPAPLPKSPSIEERIQARQGGGRAADPVTGTSPSESMTGAQPSHVARKEGADLLLLLLGAIAVLCVLGLIPLYAQVYAEYTKPPAPGQAPQPQLPATNAVAAVTNTESPPGVAPTPGAAPTVTATLTPTPTFDLPANLVGSVLDDTTRALFASKGVSLVVTSTASFEPEDTILALDPNTAQLEVSSTLTVTVSTGGRIDLNAQMPGIVVQHARFVRDEFAPGMNVQFNVAWRATRAIGKDYRVFVHLFDPSGTFIGQTGDREPYNNGAPFPTAAWTDGTFVTDTYVLQIPLNAQPGLYEIRVGLYDDAGRLPFTDGGQSVVKGSSVVVRTIRVR